MNKKEQYYLDYLVHFGGAITLFLTSIMLITLSLIGVRVGIDLLMFTAVVFLVASIYYLLKSREDDK